MNSSIIILQFCREFWRWRGVVFPLSVKLNGQDLLEVCQNYIVRVIGVTKWNKDIIERVITILYSKADAVIALSRKRP